MATAKKTTRKPTKIAELNSPEALQVELKKLRQDLADYRKSNASGDLINPRAITVTRKAVARVMTKLNETQPTPGKENK